MRGVLRTPRLFGYHGRPGTDRFKAMVREDRYKLIWLANGGKRLLFDIEADPDELRPLRDELPGVADRLFTELEDELRREQVAAAFDREPLRVSDY